MEDKQIVSLLFERSEAAIHEVEEKYRRYCHYIAYCILENDEDAKEVVNDTFLKLWNTVPPNDPDSLKSYVGMLSRQLALNLYEKNHAQKRMGQLCITLNELEECIPDTNSRENIGESMELRDALNRFLRTLPDKTQKVFVRRYWYVSSTSEIASEYGMKESNVNVMLLRTRKKLKKFLQKEGFNL